MKFAAMTEKRAPTKDTAAERNPRFAQMITVIIATVTAMTSVSNETIDSLLSMKFIFTVYHIRRIFSITSRRKIA